MLLTYITASRKMTNIVIKGARKVSILAIADEITVKRAFFSSDRSLGERLSKNENENDIVCSYFISFPQSQ